MEITLKDLKELFESKKQETGYERFKGKNVFIRSVTHHYTGRCIETTALTMALSDAAWIADDGRFNESIKNSDNFSEVEPYAKDVTINLYAILDCTEIEKLPYEVR